MERYRIITKGVFESKSKFEERINSLAIEGWRALSISQNSGQIVVLMEKPK
ncbi:MAG: hypothetical protein RIC95_06385 [Vicingaceae bacterium]